MSKTIPGNHKHMSLESRILIEKGLDAGTSFRRIAEQLGKDPSTIAKEIQKHRLAQPHNPFNEPRSKCAAFPNCQKKDLCQIYAPVCKGLCKNCGRCNSHCPDFVPRDFHCPKLDKAPFVCNGCKKKSGCRMDKSYYKAAPAHRQYRTVLVESRAGINISQDGLALLDGVITPLVKQGQSPYMILQSHPEISLSEKTIYNYIDSGALSVKNLDLAKKVKYKVRSGHGTQAADTVIYEGRTYKDYQARITAAPDTRVIEMDTVLGCEGSQKVLLTLHFDHCALMMAYLLDSKGAQGVEAVFDAMENALGTLQFLQAFLLVLTDRGGEFQHPDRLECGTAGTIRTCIYYCDPMCPWQKPHCEKNHEYIRKVCPKGTSFDAYTQADMDLMMSHINSAPRESLGGIPPLQLAELMLPKKLLAYFHLTRIPPDEVILTPALLKK